MQGGIFSIEAWPKLFCTNCQQRGHLQDMVSGEALWRCSCCQFSLNWKDYITGLQNAAADREAADAHYKATMRSSDD